MNDQKFPSAWSYVWPYIFSQIPALVFPIIIFVLIAFEVIDFNKSDSVYFIIGALTPLLAIIPHTCRYVSLANMQPHQKRRENKNANNLKWSIFSGVLVILGFILTVAIYIILGGFMDEILIMATCVGPAAVVLFFWYFVGALKYLLPPGSKN